MAEKIVLFVGTYTRMGSKGIYTCKMDPETGELQESSVAEDIENPSFLALNSAGDRLYAVWEITERGQDAAPRTTPANWKDSESVAISFDAT